MKLAILMSRIIKRQRNGHILDKTERYFIHLFSLKLLKYCEYIYTYIQPKVKLFVN
jgi:hypothetical protein